MPPGTGSARRRAAAFRSPRARSWSCRRRSRRSARRSLPGRPGWRCRGERGSRRSARRAPAARAAVLPSARAPRRRDLRRVLFRVLLPQVGLDDLGVALDLARQPLGRSEEHTSELQSQFHLVCRLLLEKKKKYQKYMITKKKKKNKRKK